MLSSGKTSESDATTAGVLPPSQRVVSTVAPLEEKVIHNHGLDSVLAKVSTFYPELSFTVQTQLSFAMFNLNTMRGKKPDDFVKSDCGESLEFVNATRMSNTERNKLHEAIEKLMKNSQETTTNDFNVTMGVINTLLNKALKEYQGDAVLYFMRAGYTLYRFDHAAAQAISDIRVAEILTLGRIDKNPANLTYCHLANRMGRLHQGLFDAALSEHVLFLSSLPEDRKILEHQYFIKQVTSLSSNKVNIDPQLSMDLLIFAETLIEQSTNITGVEVKLGTRYTEAVTSGISYLAGILNEPNAKKLPEQMQLRIETAHLSLQFANLMLENPSLAATMGISDAKKKTPAELKEERKNLQKMKQLEAKIAEQKAEAEQKEAQRKREDEAAKKLREDKIEKAKKKKEEFDAKQKADNEKKLAEQKLQEAKQEQRTIRRVMTDILDTIEKNIAKQAKKEKKEKKARAIIPAQSDAATESVVTSTSHVLSHLSLMEDLATQPAASHESVVQAKELENTGADESMILASEVDKTVSDETMTLASQVGHHDDVSPEEFKLDPSQIQRKFSDEAMAEETQHGNEINTSAETDNSGFDQNEMQTGETTQEAADEDKSYGNEVNVPVEAGNTDFVEYEMQTSEVGHEAASEDKLYPNEVDASIGVENTGFNEYQMQTSEVNHGMVDTSATQFNATYQPYMAVPIPFYVPVPVAVPMPVQVPYHSQQGNFNQPMMFPGQPNYYQSQQDNYIAQAANLAIMTMGYGSNYQNYGYQQQDIQNYYPTQQQSYAPQSNNYYPNPSISQVGHPNAFMSSQRGRHQHYQAHAERKHQPRSRRHH